MFKNFWPDFIFFEPDLLSAHLDTLGKELESDTNLHKLATIHGLSTLAQRTNIYVEPLLYQQTGKLVRGARLIDASDIAKATRNIEELEVLLAGVEDSLRIVDYFELKYQDEYGRVRNFLRPWPYRFYKEWTEAFSRATREAHLRREAPPLTVPLPQSVLSQFFSSREYQFVSNVYETLDHDIADANNTVTVKDRLELLDSASFAGYGSLVHAATVCYPTVQFSGEGLLEWSPEEILGFTSNVLITGAPGFGKSSFCRNHFLADLNNFRTCQSKILPLYFVAHSIDVGASYTFEEVFIRPEVAARLAADASLIIRIYLDGLDEVRSGKLRDDILRIAKEACTRERTRFQCVATAREHVGGYWTNWLTRVRLSPMSQGKLRDLVTAWLDGNTELISQFYSELSDSDTLLPVLSVPLLATLTVLLFKTLRRLPENKLRLYQMFIDLLLGGWNLAKGLKRSSMFSSTVKTVVLTRLAGLMHARKIKECTDLEIVSTLRQVASALVPEVQNVVAEFVEDGLLLPTGRSSYTFPHLSFQEYLAARDALDPSRQEDRKIVQSFLSGDDWYKEVATFLVSMTTNPVGMRAWIVGLAKPFAKPHTLSDSEKRAGYLLAKLTETFPDCKIKAEA